MIAQVWWTGATGSMAGTYTLRNAGDTTCTFDGVPTSFAILDASGHKLAIKVRPFRDDGDRRPIVLNPTHPGGTYQLIGVQVVWVNWCGGWSRKGSIEVGMGGLGTLRVHFTDLSAPRCDTPTASSTVTLGPFGLTE